MAAYKSRDIIPLHFTQSNMPKNINTKKSASALFQNQKAIDRAWKVDVTFGAVTRALGNGGFEVSLAEASVQATPRGLFGKGSVHIAVGHVVIVEGQMRGKDDKRASLPMEIVARLDSKADIQLFIKKGRMPAVILRIAESAGVMDSSEAAEEDIFEEAEGEEAFWGADVKGGMKQQRKAEEARRTIAARVAGLKSGRGKHIDGSVAVGEAMGLSSGTAHNLLAEAQDAESMTLEQRAEFIAWRESKKPVHVARVAGPSAAAVEKELRVAAEMAYSAADQAAICAEQAAAAHAAEVREFFAQRRVADNWDDEVNIADL